VQAATGRVASLLETWEAPMRRRTRRNAQRSELLQTLPSRVVEGLFDLALYAPLEGLLELFINALVKLLQPL
jgi:hypothetical protein